MTEEDDDIQDYKKPWIGLTYEETEYIEGMSMDAFVAIRMTEAKLKEKNT